MQHINQVKPLAIISAVLLENNRQCVKVYDANVEKECNECDKLKLTAVSPLS